MRLTATTLPKWRTDTLIQQGGLCAVCLLPVPVGTGVGDHEHSTGQMRGVLHRGCNSMVGKLENYRTLYGLADIVKLQRFMSGVVAYLHRKRPDDTPLYPTHRSADEKRVRKNKRAVIARKARKAA